MVPQKFYEKTGDDTKRLKKMFLEIFTERNLDSISTFKNIMLKKYAIAILSKERSRKHAKKTIPNVCFC